MTISTIIPAIIVYVRGHIRGLPVKRLNLPPVSLWPPVVPDRPLLPRKTSWTDQAFQVLQFGFMSLRFFAQIATASETKSRDLSERPPPGKGQ